MTEGLDYKKWWLGRYTRLNFEINVALRSIAAMRDLAMHTTQTLDAPAIQSGQADKTANIVSGIVDAEIKVDKMVDELRGLKTETLAAINSLPDPAEAKLLADHYIRGITFVDIAKRAGKGYRWVMYKYESALKNVYIDNTGGSG